MAPEALRVVFAGDRDIAVWVLESLLERGVRPLGLLVSDVGIATHATALEKACSHLDPELVLRGRRFRQDDGQAVLRSLAPDYIICVHFPYVIPPSVVRIPRIGVLNLHPALLPYNRGWNTPSWAILQGTPYGATLHFMNDELDAGDIVLQKRLEVQPGDTAHTLYQRVKALELDVFREAWQAILAGCPDRVPQDPNGGTFHRKGELLTPAVQQIRLDETTRASDLIDRLRALTTSRVDEAAYFTVGRERYRVQIRIVPEGSEPEGTPGT